MGILPGALRICDVIIGEHTPNAKMTLAEVKMEFSERKVVGLAMVQWCKPCRWVDNQYSTTNQVSDFLKGNDIKLVYLDGDHEEVIKFIKKDVPKNTGVSVPSSVVYNDGKEIGKTIGALPPDIFIQKITQG